VLAGRLTSATRLFKRNPSPTELTTRAMRAIVEKVLRAARTPRYEIDDVEPDLEAMRECGYGGYARHIVQAIGHFNARSAPGEGVTVVLTPSELRIIRSLASGMKPKDIAMEMERSVLTIQTHIKNVIEKLGCSGRDEAIAAARQLGLLNMVQ